MRRPAHIFFLLFFVHNDHDVKYGHLSFYAVNVSRHLFGILDIIIVNSTINCALTAVKFW